MDGTGMAGWRWQVKDGRFPSSSDASGACPGKREIETIGMDIETNTGVG